MASKSQKKNIIRQDIIEAANIYAEHLAGRTFLYVYAGEFFEVTFPNSCFLHLTGVETYLSANEFYINYKYGLYFKEYSNHNSCLQTWDDEFRIYVRIDRKLR